jgi:putative ABC transport system permease protein
MKSYLSLVKEYERVHKKKNRLTVICIAISVMLVTTIFSMADMSVKAQISGHISHNGNFHAIIRNITADIADKIAARKDVAVSGWIGWADDTTYKGRELLIQGGEEAISAARTLTAAEGHFPAAADEVMFDKRGMEEFGLVIGGTIDVPFADGEMRQYRITGAFGDFSSLMRNDTHGMFLSMDGVRAIPSKNYSEEYYIQFASGVNIRRSLADIKSEYSLNDEQVTENTILLGLMGQSGDSSMWMLYLTAVILFVLVTLAGVFMIAGSFNMSVSERTQFFGLLRCLGASKKQIKRYIRLEGLLYSLKGIPLGLLVGCILSWVCAFILNTIDLGDKMPPIPLFQVSIIGTAMGILMGFLVVMLASRAPAKKAAAVSPQAAATGNLTQNSKQINKSVNAHFRIDTAMGIHHAFANKKNLLLTSGSFALSVILFLSFTVLIDFMSHAVKPLKPYAPDISLMYAEDSKQIDRSMMNELKTLPGIKNMYGRSVRSVIQPEGETVVIISYDEIQFKWADDMILAGNAEHAKIDHGVLIDYNKAERSGLKIGDMVVIVVEGKRFQFPVAGILSHVPFDARADEWAAICSESTFAKITGIQDYTIIDMQVNEDISSQIRNIIPADMLLLDKQQSNQEARAAYYTMAVFIYGFLLVIALVACINILNMVSAGVSNRMRSYGIMRAVGMSGNQLKKIITAESAAYAVTGCIAGSFIGLFLHRIFFNLMVTSNWGENWRPPYVILIIIVLAALLITLAAIIAPVKRIKSMTIVDVI